MDWKKWIRMLSGVLLLFALVFSGQLGFIGRAYQPPPSCDDEPPTCEPVETSLKTRSRLESIRKLPAYTPSAIHNDSRGSNFDTTIVIRSEPGAFLGKIPEDIYGVNSWIDHPKWGLQAIPKQQIPDLQAYYDENIPVFFDTYTGPFSEVDISSIRIPGGTQSNQEDWTAISGPFVNRKNHNASGGLQITTMGIDEHIVAADTHANGASVMYTVNMVQGLLQCFDGSENILDAGCLVQKVKELETQLAGGRSVVKFYEIGNELNSGLTAGEGCVDDFGRIYGEAVKFLSRAIKAQDPNALIGAIDDLNKGMGEQWFCTVKSAAEGGNDCGQCTPFNCFPPIPCVDDCALTGTCGSFDFWIKHFYSPSTEGQVRGFTISRGSTSVEVEQNITDTQDVQFEFLAEGQRFSGIAPRFRFFVDGNEVGTITIDEFDQGQYPKAKFYRLPASGTFNLTSGFHTFRLESVGSSSSEILLRIHPSVGTIGSSDVIDFKNSEHLAAMIGAGAETLEENIRENEALFYGKPVKVTEWNTIYSFDECGTGGILEQYPERCSRNDTLREALNNARYFQVFAENSDIIDGAYFWLTNTFLGWLDFAKPEPRFLHPSYYVARMFSNHQKGERLETTVTTSSFAIGPSKDGSPGAEGDYRGVTLGRVKQQKTYPYVTSVASHNCDEVVVSVINRHPVSTTRVNFDLGDIPIADTAEIIAIGGDNLETTSLDGTQIYFNFSAPVASQFSIDVPNHTILLFKFPLTQ